MTGIVFRIAWKNLMRHRGKSLVIGSILFTGTLIMTVGNAVISGLDAGLAQNFRQRMTGDIVVVSTAQLKDNVFFTPMGEPVESIDHLDEVVKIVTRHPGVRHALPVAKGMVTVLNEDSEPYFQMLFGVNFDDYRATFPDGMTIVEGQFPSGDAHGIVMSTQSREELHKFANLWSVPVGSEIVTKNLPAGVTPDSIVRRDQMVYMGYSDRNTSLDILAPVLAIGKYAAFNGLWGFFSLIDIDSYNQCMGYFESEPAQDIDRHNQQLLAQTDNLDAVLFGDAPTTAPVTPSIETVATAAATSGYNLILVRLKPSHTIESTIHQLDAKFKSKDLPARAISWKAALGQVAQIALLMRAVLFGFVMIVFIVAIIVITNTLSLAAMERITEIGMMRAIGARRSIISKLFITETGILSIVFGGAGIITGTILTLILQLLHIKADNNFVELFFGGTTFNPVLSLSDIGLGIIQLVIVTIVAVIYPILIARKISPMDAISRE